MPCKANRDVHFLSTTQMSIEPSSHARRSAASDGDARWRSIFQLPFTCQDGAKQGHDLLPWHRRAGGDVVPRVRARLGVLAA